MIDLTAYSNEGADLHWPDVCLNSLTPPARNTCQPVVSADGFQGAEDAASNSGSASKDALVLLRSNLHQNVHQRIEKDRIGYVRIRPDFCCKLLIISLLHPDSNPRLHPYFPQEFVDSRLNQPEQGSAST